MILLNKVTCGDSAEILSNVVDGSVNMVMTSPPYDGLRTYNGYSFNFEMIAKHLYRVLCDGGVMVWVVGDATVNGSETTTSFRQAIFLNQIGFNLHDTMIYQKENYVPLTHNRYEQAFEYMFCFSKGKPNTFTPVRIERKHKGKSRSGTFIQKPSDKKFTRAHSNNPVNDTKISSNIFTYSIGHQKVGHPAVFPIQLALDQISTWTEPGDIVLDPFCGSGTTGLACLELERFPILIEISEDYCSIARQRLRLPG